MRLWRGSVSGNDSSLLFSPRHHAGQDTGFLLFQAWHPLRSTRLRGTKGGYSRLLFSSHQQSSTPQTSPNPTKPNQTRSILYNGLFHRLHLRTRQRGVATRSAEPCRLCHCQRSRQRRMAARSAKPRRLCHRQRSRQRGMAARSAKPGRMCHRLRGQYRGLSFVAHSEMESDFAARHHKMD